MVVVEDHSSNLKRKKTSKMKSLLLVLCVLGASVAAPADPEPERRLIFEDEFNTLDHSVWQHERTASGGGVSRNFGNPILK